MERTKELTEKYAKTMSNVIEFAKEHAYTFNPHKGVIENVELFDYQKKMLKSFEKNKFTIVKQSRQVGIDTVVAIYIAYLLMKSNGKTILAVYESADVATRFIEKVRDIIIRTKESYGIENRKIFIINNKKELRLRNESRLMVTGGSPDGGRGCGIDLLFMNNFEFIPHSKEFWEASGMALSSSDGKAIFASVPRYKESHFYKLWTSAIKKTNYFKPINVTWKQNPNFDDAWYKNMCKTLNNDSDSIAMELDGKFAKKKGNTKKQQSI